MCRKRKGPKRFHGQFNGILQTDGCAAYEDEIGGPKMVHACCLAHSRRKYINAVARDKKMSHAQRHTLCMEKAPPPLAELRTQIRVAQEPVLPKSTAGRAASYTLSLWNKLTRFLEHPVLELSNNLAENSMRQMAIGRRNWIHIGQELAGPKIATIFSIV